MPPSRPGPLLEPPPAPAPTNGTVAVSVLLPAATVGAVSTACEMNPATAAKPTNASCVTLPDCRFASVTAALPGALDAARGALTAEEISLWLAAVNDLARWGRGDAPPLALLKAWPAAASVLGASALTAVLALARSLQRSPNSHAIAPYLESLPALATRLRNRDALTEYHALLGEVAARTTAATHGRHAMQPSATLVEFIRTAPRLLARVDIAALRQWANDGLRYHQNHPEQLGAYFRLQSPESRAAYQQRLGGTRLTDIERRLQLTLRALWPMPQCDLPIAPIAEPAFADGSFSDERRASPPTLPCIEGERYGLPEHYAAAADDGTVGPDGALRYRLALAHLAGHRAWSVAQVADNWSPMQRLAVECFEDARIDRLLTARWPGLLSPLLALHPRPDEHACDERTQSCLRHRLVILSRALLDPAHGYRDATLRAFVARFEATCLAATATTRDAAALALQWVARTRRASDQAAAVHFTDTTVPWRDDNRHLWRYIEAGDEEEAFARTPTQSDDGGIDTLPPRYYPEWDPVSQTLRPDWTAVYERLQPAGDGAQIDALLDRHQRLARQLARQLEALRAQDRQRQRYQASGSDLDLDIAVRAMVDRATGNTPDERIECQHRPLRRDVAVLLLLDLSESLNAPAGDGQRTRLALSQEAVALLAWAVDRLGDRLAIAGFHSNTRHDVRYYHIKGFSERWAAPAKARLAGVSAAWSTRMGAALRHAAHYLGSCRADKKLLLVLTDGEPADVDCADGHTLIEDARVAVRELAAAGIYCHCINLDASADAPVVADSHQPGTAGYVRTIFGKRYTVVDRLERLPEALPKLFVALTR